jgi:hypothetical protein
LGTKEQPTPFGLLNILIEYISYGRADSKENKELNISDRANSACKGPEAGEKCDTLKGRNSWGMVRIQIS